MSDKSILDECTLEDLGRAGLQMYQLKDGFRFGLDSVLLSWFAASFVRNSNASNNSSKVTAKTTRVLELGAGCGACTLLMHGRKPNVRIDSVELMNTSALVLEENIRLNKLEDKIRVFNADIRKLPSDVRDIQYDIVMFNPPFFLEENGPKTTSSKSVERLNGRFEENGSLNDFVKVAASRVIPTSGFVVMIMKGSRLTDSIRAFEANKITPTHLLTVHPFDDKNGASFLLCGKRGIKGTELKILPPLILNCRDANGNIKSTDVTTMIYEKEHSTNFI